VTAGVDIPVLRKDFLLDPAQIWEARAAGADAVLLIVALLDDRCLDEMLAASADAGLEALVEVHRRPELRRALDAGASLIGVNNRDLETFQTDLGVAERLAHDLEGFNGVAVAESGVSTKAGAARMRAAGYDAILVGEALMRSSAPAALIGSLRGAA
jgi:indole-3-glycerol phosphate synthase